MNKREYAQANKQWLAQKAQEEAVKLEEKLQHEAQEQINKFKELKSFVAVGKFYNVSDTTIRKWCKKYEIPCTKKELVLFLKDSN